MTAEIGSRGRVQMNVTGVHVPLRIYRYEPGQHFGLHQDQSYFSQDGAKSLLTFMVHLNDDFEGGETDFPEQGETIIPKTGSALLFQHMLLHAGKPASAPCAQRARAPRRSAPPSWRATSRERRPPTGRCSAPERSNVRC